MCTVTTPIQPILGSNFSAGDFRRQGTEDQSKRSVTELTTFADDAILITDNIDL